MNIFWCNFSSLAPWIRIYMDIFWIPDPDNNRCGSATLLQVCLLNRHSIRYNIGENKEIRRGSGLSSVQTWFVPKQFSYLTKVQYISWGIIQIKSKLFCAYCVLLKSIWTLFIKDVFSVSLGRNISLYEKNFFLEICNYSFNGTYSLFVAIQGEWMPLKCLSVCLIA